ncbi:MAG: hypothetical protein EPO02_01850 [Nitrospirae bacterium]|nr:MAG: hypothetical protein EPO02_01850 [Nitrospirota bacterium]
MAPRFAALVFACILWASPSAGESSRPLVGHVMALLAVFEQAEALPLESSPEANALIHALVQTQAALTKSTNRAARAWFADALHRSHSPGAEPTLKDGLTTRALEAILAHAASHPPAERPEVRAGLLEFNVRQSDLDLLARVYGRARDRFRSSGQDIHRIYEEQRRSMPFR